ncbi:MAG: hypothetical protein ACEQSB_00040 [Undibacterium sp.]
MTTKTQWKDRAKLGAIASGKFALENINLEIALKCANSRLSQCEKVIDSMDESVEALQSALRRANRRVEEQSANLASHINIMNAQHSLILKLQADCAQAVG